MPRPYIKRRDEDTHVNHSTIVILIFSVFIFYIFRLPFQRKSLEQTRTRVWIRQAQPSAPVKYIEESEVVPAPEKKTPTIMKEIPILKKILWPPKIKKPALQPRKTIKRIVPRKREIKKDTELQFRHKAVSVLTEVSIHRVVEKKSQVRNPAETKPDRPRSRQMELSLNEEKIKRVAKRAVAPGAAQKEIHRDFSPKPVFKALPLEVNKKSITTSARKKDEQPAWQSFQSNRPPVLDDAPRSNFQVTTAARSRKKEGHVDLGSGKTGPDLNLTSSMKKLSSRSAPVRGEESADPSMNRRAIPDFEPEEIHTNPIAKVHEQNHEERVIIRSTIVGSSERIANMKRAILRKAEKMDIKKSPYHFKIKHVDCTVIIRKTADNRRKVILEFSRNDVPFEVLSKLERRLLRGDK